METPRHLARRGGARRSSRATSSRGRDTARRRAARGRSCASASRRSSPAPRTQVARVHRGAGMSVGPPSPARRPRRLPDPPSASSRASPLVYLDSAATSQKPRAGDRGDRRLLPAPQRQRSTAASTTLAQEATEPLRGRARAVAALRRREPDDHDLHPERHRGDQPRGLRVGARATSARATRCSSRRWSTTRTSCPGSCCAQETGADAALPRASTTSGQLSLDELDAVLADGRVKLVAVAHVSNVLGTINPVAEIAARAARRRRGHARRRLAGGAAAARSTWRELGADFYAWTGHKALGPTGIGVLHGRRELLEAMRPFLGGGDMISTVALERSTWNELPWKFEAGTSPVAEGVGLGAAIDYLRRIGMERVRAHEKRPHRLRARAAGRGRRRARLRPAGPRAPRRRRLLRASTASTRTTWPSCATATASASAPATTAPSR